jgi:hypothetical protein
LTISSPTQSSTFPVPIQLSPPITNLNFHAPTPSESYETAPKQSIIENSLLLQFIAPTLSASQSPIYQATLIWMVEKLKGKKSKECQFVVTDPTQSGKSTLLSITGSLFYQKLHLANEGAKYLIVCVNWLFHQIYIDNLSNFFFFTTLMVFRGSDFELIPIIPALREWFLSLVTSDQIPE